MGLLQNLDLLSVGVAVAAIAVLGFVVFYTDRKSATNQSFLAFCGSTIFWGVANYASYKSHTPELGFWLLRISLFFAVCQAFFLFLFFHIFPEKQFSFSKKFKLILVPLVYLTAFLTLTPLVLNHWTALSPQGQILEVANGPGIALFGVLNVGLIIAAFYTLLRKIFKSEGSARKSLRLILLGTFFMFFLIIIFNFILPAFYADTDFIAYGAVFVFPFVALTSYSILRHGLLDIRFLSAEILVFLLAVMSFFEILISEDLYTVIFRIAVFLLILSFGVRLIEGVIREVRQRKQLEKLSKQLEQANIQLKQLDQAKSEFLSVASHQLRTPLTAIKGYVSMLLSGDFGKLDPKQEQPIKIVYDSSQRLVELIADLLDLSRIESGTMEFNFTAVDLGPMIESVIDELKQRAQGHKLYLYFDNIHSKCPVIRADAEKTRQIIINLIDNAIKYTTAGGVTLRLHNTGSTLQLEVSDTGIGIDPEDQKKIFQKFFRTNAANEITREGTGLGIYVVKKLVEVQGGKIWFDSKGLGKGTTFYVSFPLPEGKIIEETLKIKSLEAF